MFYPFSPNVFNKWCLKIHFKSSYLLFLILFLCYFIPFLLTFSSSYICIFVSLLFCNYMYLYVVVTYFIPAYCSIIINTLLLTLITFSLFKCKYHATVTPNNSSILITNTTFISIFNCILFICCYIKF